jgi:hypothetical protein
LRCDGPYTFYAVASLILFRRVTAFRSIPADIFPKPRRPERQRRLLEITHFYRALLESKHHAT